MKITEPGSGRPALERITVNFIPRTSEALARGTELTQYSKTDFINRAVQAYAFLEEQASKGCDVLIREPGTSELSKIIFA